MSEYQIGAPADLGQEHWGKRLISVSLDQKKTGPEYA